MADLKLARFNPEPCNFPRPRVPLLPTSLRVGLARSGASESAHKSTFRHFTRGRYALGEAYRLAGVGRDGALLAPAYHCITMLDPALDLGANVHLYALNADLSPDLNQLEELLSSLYSHTPVKALLATHFFGMTKDFNRLKQWCEKRRISLIEDCSHVLFIQDFQTVGTSTYAASFLPSIINRGADRLDDRCCTKDAEISGKGCL